MTKQELLSLLDEVTGDSNGVVKSSSADIEKFRVACANVDWTDKNQTKAIADTIVRKLEEQIRTEDISQFYASRDTFGVNETPEYQYQKGLKAYIHEPYTFAPRSTIIQRTVTLDTELVSVHPEFEISQLQGGRFGSLANIKSMALQEFAGHRNAVLFNTLINSVSSASVGTNYFSFVSTDSAAIKKNFLVSGIDYVDDVSPAGIQAIVGRRSVLGFIMEIEGYSDAFQEIRDRGGNLAGGVMMGSFRGIPIVALHQYTDGYDVNRINASNIMIVAKDTTKLAITEPLGSLEGVRVDDRVWSMHMFEKYGAAVLWPDRNVRLAIT